MPVRDTIALLRDLNPVEAHPPPRRVPPRRRGGARFVLLAVTTTAAVALGLIASFDERTPGLAEAAYATLTARDRIVHLRLHSQFHFPHDQSATTEMWTRAAGRQAARGL